MIKVNTKLLELGLTPKELTVLLHISKSANRKKQSCLSIETLSKEVNVGRDSIFKAIKGLVDKGLISQHKDVFTRKNIYTIKTNSIN